MNRPVSTATHIHTMSIENWVFDENEKVWLGFLLFHRRNSILLFFCVRQKTNRNNNCNNRNVVLSHHSPNSVVVLAISMPSLVRRYLYCCIVCKRLDTRPPLLVLIPSYFFLLYRFFNSVPPRYSNYMQKYSFYSNNGKNLNFLQLNIDLKRRLHGAIITCVFGWISKTNLIR